MTTSPPHAPATESAGLRAFGRERLDLAPRPVVDRHLVARLDQVRGHGRPHVAQTDEADSSWAQPKHRSWSAAAGPEVQVVRGVP